MKNTSFLELCAQAFLCRLDKAITNIALMFAGSVVFVLSGKRAGLLLSPSDTVIDLTTGVVVTLLAVGLGILRKKEIV